MDTINFARTLPVDMMKFGITIAFPGTPMFNNYVKKGLIRSYDWDEYFIYTTMPLFTHPALSYDTIQEFVKKAHRKAIFLNPAFWIRRILRGIKTGEFFWDVYYAIQYFSKPTVGESLKTAYYARGRWPQFNFGETRPTIADHQVVHRKRPEAMAKIVAAAN
jgi:anaerobic magnesium-protoporphyrin IX monomethyl ester cyclase